MTSRSEHTGYIRGPAGFITTDGPADAGALRDGLINNVNHLLDECTQVRAAITLAAGSYYEQNPTDTSVYGMFDQLPPIVFPIMIHPSGDSTVIVPHMRASISAAGTASFALRLTFREAVTFGPSTVSAVSNIVGVTTTSTTATDLTLSPLYISRGVIDAHIADAGGSLSSSLSSFASTNGDGSSEVGKMLMVQLEVWAKSSSAQRYPRLHGLYLREFIG